MSPGGQFLVSLDNSEYVLQQLQGCFVFVDTLPDNQLKKFTPSALDPSNK